MLINRVPGRHHWGHWEFRLQRGPPGTRGEELGIPLRLHQVAGRGCCAWLLGANYTARPASLGPAHRAGPQADCAQGRSKLSLGDRRVPRGKGQGTVGSAIVMNRNKVQFF